MIDSAEPLGRGRPIEEQLVTLAELVEMGPIDFGCYTQAEMAVVLGDVPALAGLADDVLAEGVRSLAARGLLYRSAGGEHVDVVGELGLLSALAPLSPSTIEIRRGHAGSPDEPWRWLIALLPHGVAAVDRIDVLGLHRLAMISTAEVADAIVSRMIDGPARIPKPDPGPVAATLEEVRAAAERSQTRWQIAHRIRHADGTLRETELQVMRTGEHRVELLTPDPDGAGYHRTALDADSLRSLVADLARLR